MRIKELWEKLEAFRLEQCTDLVTTIPDRELECKIDTNEVDILELYHQLEEAGSLRYDGLPYRKETHQVYESGELSRILIAGSDEVWIKEKKNNDSGIIQIPSVNVPILDRMEKKLNPRNFDYQKTLTETLKMAYVGQFEKECFDLCLKKRNFHFTITYAVSTHKQVTLPQMEIEYEGYSAVNISTNQPSLAEIIEVYEEILGGHLYNFLDRFTSLRKSIWLKELNSEDYT